MSMVKKTDYDEFEFEFVTGNAEKLEGRGQYKLLFIVIYTESEHIEDNVNQ